MNIRRRNPDVANDLLATLEPDAFAGVAARLEPTVLHVKQVLSKPGEHIREVCFPDDSVIVLLAVDSAGRTIESGTVGHEGAGSPRA